MTVARMANPMFNFISPRGDDAEGGEGLVLGDALQEAMALSHQGGGGGQQGENPHLVVVD